MVPVDLSELDVIEAVPVSIDRADAETLWPCPYCDRRRRLDRASSVRVRNRTGRPSQRWVLMCNVCVDRVS